MKYIVCFLCLFLFTINLSAQNCNCDDNFRFLTDKIKRNYIGYPDKVNSSNQFQFQKFTDSLQHIASVSNPYRCLSLIREWLSFFKDKHIEFGMDFNKLSADSVRFFFANEEKTRWTESSFKTYLEQSGTILDSIEGIWTTGIYEVGIVKDNSKTATEFIGFVIKADSARWMPQQIKFKIAKIGSQYKTIYFNGGDHSVQFPNLIAQKDLLDFGIFGKWKRGEKKSKTSSPVKYVAPDLMASFKVLDKQTSLITLPSFDFKYKLRIDSLIDSNKDNLANTEHLIVDMRDNPGGITGCFDKLLPYLYTNPIYVDGGIVLATGDNIHDGFEKNYPYATPALKKTMKKNAKKLRVHQGEFYKLYTGRTIKFSKIFKTPSRISILINEHTASSGEFFILRAEQSKKVTLFGRNTAGCVDYADVIITHPPCDFFTLTYPITKSLHSIKRPLDNIGIAPNIRIPENEKDWVNFVKNYKNN